jgi:uncharacterized C2H2 Zn-finger protein
MTELPPIALRVRPAPLEPGWALFNRLALRHGCESRSEFALQVSFTKRRTLIRDLECGRNQPDIARLTGFPLETLVRNSITHTDDGSVLAGELVSRSGSMATTCNFARICPDCLRADVEERDGPIPCRPWRRSWWDVAKISSCPRHGRVLLASCPACGRIFRRSDLSPAHCICGHHVLEDRTEPVEPDSRIGDAYLVGRLGGGPRIAHGFLDGLAFADAAEVMQWLGGIARWGRSILAWRHQDMAERACTMTAGYAVCQDFPGRLQEMLDAMIAGCPCKRLTPQGVYGDMQTWLGVATHPAFDPIREIVRNNVVKHLPITAGTKLFRNPVPMGELTTLGALAKLLGVSTKGVVRAASVLGMILPSSRPCDGTIVPKSFEGPLAVFLGEICSRAEACHHLGTTSVLFKVLSGRNYFPRGYRLGGLWYRLADLDRFLEVLYGDAPFVNRPLPGSATIKSAVYICHRSSDEIIDGLLHGQIKAAGRLRGERGIAQILVDTDAVIVALQSNDDPALMPMLEVARQLSVAYPTVGRLARLGWFAVESKPTWYGAAQTLRRTEIEAFGKRFVSASELARLLPKAARTASVDGYLKKAGVTPAIAGGRHMQPLYDREIAESKINDLLLIPTPSGQRRYLAAEPELDHRPSRNSAQPVRPFTSEGV